MRFMAATHCPPAAVMVLETILSPTVPIHPATVQGPECPDCFSFLRILCLSPALANRRQFSGKKLLEKNSQTKVAPSAAWNVLEAGWSGPVSNRP
jgi:hypothetical protein